MFYDVIIRYRHKFALLCMPMMWCAIACNKDDLVWERRYTLFWYQRLCLYRMSLYRVLTVYGDLTRALVNFLIQYFCTCASASIIDVFHFVLVRFICYNNEMSWLFRHSQRLVRKPLLETFNRSTVAPHTHYWQLIGCNDITVVSMLLVGVGGTF